MTGEPQVDPADGAHLGRDTMLESDVETPSQQEGDCRINLFKSRVSVLDLACVGLAALMNVSSVSNAPDTFVQKHTPQKSRKTWSY